MTQIGKVLPTEIVSEMETSYINYAMTVIVGRALPDVRDGLKPVHRRIIYGMARMGLRHSAKYQKSAKVVGEVMGKYHPHGDAPVYDALVRMAQDFSLRYTLVDGQGNFGSVDGDSPAAMRYCLTGESRIVTHEGIRTIGSLYNTNDDIDITVLSKDRTLHHASKWFDSGIHPIIQVTTSHGFTIRGTANHPILVWAKDASGKPKMVWKMLAHIQQGDIAVIDRTSDLLWPEVGPDLQNYYPTQVTARAVHKVLPKHLSEDLGGIMGALIAEGSIHHNEIEFCNSDTEWIQSFTMSWHRVFPDCRLHHFYRKASSYGKLPYETLEIHSRFVVEFLRNLGVLPVKAAEKSVPEAIFLASKPVVAAFLANYFEGDGSISASGRMIELSCCSASETLISQIQLLLLRFGIVATKRYDSYRSMHKLYIRGLKNYRIFQSEIGFISQRKQDKLALIMASMAKESSLSDTVPYIASYIRNHLDHQQKYYARAFVYKHNFDQYGSMAQNYKQVILTMPQAEQLETHQTFEQLLKNNYLFDKIVEKKKMKPERVYSIRVDSDCHSFVANGFINHNTECRLDTISDELLRDLDKETVEFIDNFDGSEQEPTVLPAVMPNLLVNGGSGIAVGMATNIPTHNLGELSDALLFMLQTAAKADVNPPDGKTNDGGGDSAIATATEKFESTATTEDLLKFIKGPDFPTAGIIYDQKEIANAYATGKGRIVMRAKAEIEETKGGRFDIVITELPYQVNKAQLVARIADLVKDKKVEGISDLRDESDRRGMRVVVELKRDARPQSVLNNLFKYTAMQSVFNVNMVALVDGTPQLLSLKTILEAFIGHRIEIITRRSIFELKQARAREHILEGLKIAVDNIDEVIRIIRASESADVARTNLMEKFALSEIQATAILDMQLRRLAALERQKIEDELKQVRELIAYLEDLLAHREKILSVIEDETKEIRDKYADPRRTKVVKGGVGEFSEEDLIANEQTIITLTRGGYIKRQGMAAFRTQARGGKGVSGVTLKDEDAILNMITASTHDNVLFFTNKGRVFQIKAWEITEATRTAKGQAIVNIIDLGSDEKVTSILPVTAGAKANTGGFAFMVTRKGTVKKTKIGEYANIRKSGLIAIKLEAGDQLIWAKTTSGDDHLILTTASGRSVRFHENDVRPTGRDTMGVRGIMLKGEDYIVGMDVISGTDIKKLAQEKDPKIRAQQEPQIVTIMENGLGKRTHISQYPLQKRGGQGVKAASVTAKTGQLVFSAVAPKDVEHILLTTERGQTIRLPFVSVPLLKRDTQGVILIRMQGKDDRLAAAALITAEEEKQQ